MEQLDLYKILKEKAPKLYKRTPNFVIELLGKIIHLKEMNKIIADNDGKRGVDFADAILNTLNIKNNVIFVNEQAIKKGEKYVFVSNHPLGGLDGLTITSEITKRFGPAKFIVNEILMGVEPLREIFVPVRNLGTASRDSINQIQELYSSDFQVLNFPAGACSRLIKGKIQDLEWKKSFVKQAQEAGRTIVPIYFGGKNSKHFYWISKIRKAIGIKAFIEMILLPDEMFRNANKTFDLVIGEPITPEQIKQSGDSYSVWCDRIRKIIYDNGTRYSTYR